MIQGNSVTQGAEVTSGLKSLVRSESMIPPDQLTYSSHHPHVMRPQESKVTLNLP